MFHVILRSNSVFEEAEGPGGGMFYRVPLQGRLLPGEEDFWSLLVLLTSFVLEGIAISYWIHLK
jgi:hypothetical protein